MKKTAKKIAAPGIQISWRKEVPSSTPNGVSNSKNISTNLSPELTFLLNNTEESFLFIDTDFKIVLFNRKFDILYKTYFGKETKKGDSILDYAQPHRAEIVKQIYLRVFKGETLEPEIELPGPDKSVHVIANKFKPAYDNNGHINGAFVSITDITETKKAEKLLKEERMLLRTLIDNLPINVYTKDLQSRKTLANRTDYEYAGFTNEESVLGKDDFELFSEESAAATIEEDKFIFSTGQSIIAKEEHHVKKDGNDIWFLISKIPLKNEKNEVTGLLGISYDITERKKMVEKLEENKATLQKAFDIAALGSWKYNIKQDYYEWSKSALGVLGLKKEDTPATWNDYLKLIPEEDTSQVLENITKAEKSGIFDTEHRLNIYGMTKWVRVKSHLEYDKNGSSVTSTGIIQDITDRKLLEQQLINASHFNHTIIETSPAGIWIYDESGQTISANKAAIELSGANPEKLLQLNYKNIPVWKEVGLYDAAMEAMQSEKPVRKEVHFINSFKKEVWFDALLTTVQFKGKKHLILMTYDIKDRMKAEESLRNSEKQLSLAMKIARLGHWEFDVAENLFTFNDQFFAMLKTTVKKVGNYRLSPLEYAEKFVHPDDRALVGIEVEKALTTTDPNFSSYLEHRVIFGNGEVGYISVNFYIIKDCNGKTIKTYGVNQDITERKKTEEEIRVAKERYEMVARATNDAIYEWDIVNDVNYWGEGYETLFGHKRTGDKMDTATWTDNIHPEEKEHLFAATYDAFAKRLPSLTRELRFKCADGSYKTVFDKLIILYNNDGKPLKIVGAMQDITERKQHELAIQELNEQLNKRAQQLTTSNTELERFAYVASHDLQEPLRMVSSFLQLLQKKYDGQLDETATQYIDYAVNGADRMKRLIMDLLEYSRVGTNRDKLVETDMGEIVTQLLGTFAGKIHETGAKIKVQLMPVVKANKTQMAQLLQNLVSNAFKYNTSAVPEIEIGCEEKEDVWQFFVKDNGIGIDPKFFDKVFVIFQRLHNKNQFSGTGIGLAICKKIIEKHGGNIWIESSVGNGSTFFFTIKKF